MEVSLNKSLSLFFVGMLATTPRSKVSYVAKPKPFSLSCRIGPADAQTLVG